MRKINALVVMILIMLVAPLLSGCVVVSDEAVFKSSSNFDIPNLSGAFRSGQAEDKNAYLLSLVEGTTNTFNLTASDKSSMTLIFEPLNTTGRYAVQISNPGGPEVLFGICDLQQEGILNIYALNLKQVAALAQKHGLTLDDRGKITPKPSVKNLKDFLEASFDPEYSAIMQTVTPGSPKK